VAKFGEGGELLKCSFCGKSQKQVKKLIAFGDLPTPAEIHEFLNTYIIGQEHAKKILAVAVYNHYKRVEFGATLDNEVELSKALALVPASPPARIATTSAMCLPASARRIS